MSEEKKWIDKVIYINRVSKVVKGGKRVKFTAVVVVGDKNGTVGVGLGKAVEIASAIKKGINNAKKNLISFPLIETTIPHEVTGKYGATLVIFKPAFKGTGVIAGGAVRSILEVSGIKDILTKAVKRKSRCNLAKATINALMKLKWKEKTEKLREKKEEKKD